MEKTEKAAYMITSGVIADMERMKEYLAGAKPLFLRAGAEEVAFGHQDAKGITLLEGEYDLPGFTMIFKFPSMNAMRKFWDSTEYQKWKNFRDQGVVEGNYTIAIEDRETW
jgi:uncharacterized protein (DUF1330 family)